MVKKRTSVNANFLHNNDYKSQHLIGVDTKSVERFFNRELSWISFNDRVLEEAGNNKVPLLERVRFLAISAENLDEFYSVRVAGLKELVRENLSRISIDGLSPQEQIEKIEKLTRSLIEKQQIIWKELLNWVKKNNGKIKIFNDSKKAAKGSDVIFTDKVISMNDNVNKFRKIKNFKKFKVTSAVMKCAKKDAIFLHCLPRGPEVSNDVFLGKQSKVFEQALNRVYVQKSILLYCFEKLR